MISSLDHLVLTVSDIDNTVDFYTRVLGMQKQVFGDNRVALKFGAQKFNLHQHGNEFEPKAHSERRLQNRAKGFRPERRRLQPRTAAAATLARGGSKHCGRRLQPLLSGSSSVA